MVNPVSCATASLPISIDVVVNVTKEQVLATVDLSIPLLVVSTGPLSQGAGRVQFFDTLSALEAVFGSSSEAAKAGTAFFSQSPRPKTMGVGQAFSSPVAGFLVAGASGTVAAFTAVSDGTFDITIDGVLESITGLDFTTDTDFDDIALTIETALQAIGAGGYTAATVTASNTTSNQFTITSGTTGDLSTVSLLATEGTGTDVSGVGFINGQAGAVVQGYAPTTFTNELNLIQQAASCEGKFVYGWALDATYRDSAEQLEAAAWAEPQQFVFMTLLSNNPLSYDADDTSNNIYTAFTAGYTRTLTFFDDDVEQYPDMACLAILLSVDYAGLNTALTLKFKNLAGIPPVQFFGVDIENAVNVLISRRANTFTITGNGARVTREGTQASTVWFCDDRTNVDNFVNDLLTGVYNVFLTTPKVPFTNAGTLLLQTAETTVCNKYVRNGTLAPRVVTDTTKPNGISTIPAYQILFPPLQDVTEVDRTTRLLQGNQITLQLSDAIHKIDINVTVVA